MDSYHPIACNLHDYPEIACPYRYRLLLEFEGGVRFEAETRTTHTWAVRPGGSKEKYLEMVTEGATLLPRLDCLLATSALMEAALFDRIRLRKEACSRASGMPSSHLGNRKGFSQFQGYSINLLLKQAGFVLMQINSGVGKMSVAVTERDDDHKSRELRVLGRHCWDVHQQGLLVDIFHNEDDAHAYRVRLKKGEELRQIGKSARIMYPRVLREHIFGLGFRKDSSRG